MKAFKSAALLAVVLTAGCMDQNPTTIQVLAARPFDDSCVVQPGGDVYVPWGYLDVSFPNRSFIQGFDVRNNLTANPDESTFRLNTNDYVMEKAVVTYAGVESAIDQQVSAFSTETPVAGTIEAGGSVGVIAELIPSNIAEVLSQIVQPGEVATVLAQFHIEGHTLDLADLESSEFSFPINVCNGCIANACGVDQELVFLCNFGQGPFECQDIVEEEPTP